MSLINEEEKQLFRKRVRRNFRIALSLNGGSFDQTLMEIIKEESTTP
jgi:hypothetical protein